ncbi:MAG: type II secretion system GspH family protein [Proteobacteria bacterium]|nr:type II secretion system GspH family protein [Pseudomonadota bacterium]MBU1716270.1 type II secretion system GspH family protein [Pseudomonadota bacterium]
MTKHPTQKSANAGNNRPSSAFGFSLLELIITIVILGFSSLVLIPFFNAITRSPDPMIRQRAISLGQGLMDEILAKKWDENTPLGGGAIATSESTRGLAIPASAIGAEGGETRIDYDDVDDYHNLTETNDFRDQNNTLFILNGYGRTAKIEYIASNATPITTTAPTGALTAASATDSKRIVVTVTAPNQEQFSFVSVVCNF